MQRLFIAVLCLFYVNTQAQDSCNFKINGHVVDKDLSSSLTDATIAIINNNLKTISDREGNFEFANLCPGEYTLTISHIGCITMMRKISVFKNVHIDIELPHAIKHEAEVTVASTALQKNSGFVKELTTKQIDAAKGGTVSELLSKINGVTLLQTGSTISKPIVHGLSGVRIIMVNNGVRQEGQQWGNEHAPEIDPFLISKVVLIKGVDELKYGSDAIGGVIVTEPKSLQLLNNKSLTAYTGFSTNNKLHYLSLQYEAAQNVKLQYRLQGSFRKAASVTTPKYVLNNTAFSEINGSFGLRYLHKKTVLDFFVSQFYTKLGIFSGAHIGNLTDLLTAISANNPSEIFVGNNTFQVNRPRQQVTHQLVKLKLTKQYLKTKFISNLNVQRNLRKEFDIVRNSSNTQPQLSLQLTTIYEDLQLEHKLIKNSAGIIGVAATQQINDYSGRYLIPNYVSNSIGVFALQKWVKPHWEYQAGIRADYKSIATKRLRFNGVEVNNDFNFKTIAASANLTRKFTNHFTSNIAVTLSSRAPYVNELLTDGIHHGTATFEQGNLQLKPEKSLFLNWNLKYESHDEKLNIEFNLHRNYIGNYIYWQPKPNDPVLTIAGAFPKVVSLQNDVVLTGLDLSLNTKIAKSIQYAAKGNVIIGDNKFLNDYLIGLPPIQIEQSLLFTVPNFGIVTQNEFGVNLLALTKQHFLPNDFYPKYDYKIAPKSYQLIGINWQAQLKLGAQNCTLVLSVDNLLNTTYRNYLNSMRYFIDEMGRNINCKIKIPIKFK